LAEARERAVTAWGADHPRVADCLLVLAQLYRLRGELVRAQSHVNDVIRIWTDTLGAECPDLAEAFLLLACIHMENGLKDDALTALQCAAKSSESRFLAILAICSEQQ